MFKSNFILSIIVCLTITACDKLESGVANDLYPSQDYHPPISERIFRFLKEGNIKEAKKLLQAKPNLLSKKDTSEKALYSALQCKDAQIRKAVLDLLVLHKPSLSDYVQNYKAFFVALENDDLKTVKNYISKMPMLKKAIGGKYNDTSENTANNLGNWDILKELQRGKSETALRKKLNKEVDIFLTFPKNFIRKTSFNEVCRKGNVDFVKLALEKEPSLGQGVDGKNAILNTLQCPNEKYRNQTLKALVENNKNLAHYKKEYKNFFNAIEKNDAKEVEKLLRGNSELLNTIGGKENMAPLVIAYKKGNILIVETLWMHNFGMDNYAKAIAGGHLKFLQILLDKEYRKENYTYLKNEDDNNLLHMAAEAFQPKIVKELLERDKTLLYQVNVNGDKPIDLARKTSAPSNLSKRKQLTIISLKRHPI